jgi:hypothetical protein
LTSGRTGIDQVIKKQNVTAIAGGRATSNLAGVSCNQTSWLVGQETTIVYQLVRGGGISPALKANTLFSAVPVTAWTNYQQSHRFMRQMDHTTKTSAERST